MILKRCTLGRSVKMAKDVNMLMREWWLKEIKAITAKVMREEDKRQARQKEKAAKALGEYQSYRDIQDAYGCGVISEREFDRLTELLERTQPEESKLYRAKIELLQELYDEQKKILDDWEKWEQVHNEQVV